MPNFYNTLRLWATPLTIGAFGLLAVTGVLMFFHADTGLNKMAHEWLGWALVVGGLAHLTLHWASFKRHVARPWGWAIMGFFAVVLAFSFVPLGAEGKGGNPMMRAAMAVSQAPLTTVAPLAGKTPEAVVAALQAQGFTVTDASRESLASLSGADKGRQMKALAALFQ